MLARILFVLLAFTTLVANAQSPWSLTNISNATLQFDTYDPARGSWKGQTIYPQQLVRYTMSPGTDSGKFRIATQNRGFVEYRVLSGRSYTLGWNQEKGVWDLKFAPGSSADQGYQAKQPGDQRNQGNRGNQDYQSNQAPRSVGSYQLINTSNEKLNFETFDPARGTWRAQTAFPNENKTFTLSSGTTAGKIRVATTGRGFVEYDVRDGWKYKVFFDGNKGVWDLRTLARN